MMSPTAIVVLASLLLFGCGNDSDDSNALSDAGSSGSGGSAKGGGGTGGSSDGGGGSSIIIGGPGCGLKSAAFCDTFDAPSSNRGRAGELDRAEWSGSRMTPTGPTAAGQAFGIRAATLRPSRDGTQLPVCRTDLATQVFPPADTTICDASSDIESSHLLVAVASQNYGQNSYRIRRPIDFAGRTGKIVFDAEAMAGGLLGWISIAVTEDPIGAPSFQSQSNYEGGLIPRNGISIQFNEGCQETGVSVSEVHVFDDYVETISKHPEGSSPVCVETEWGKLNRFEILVSENQIDVSISPFSSDGVTVHLPVLVWSGAVSLPFSRGYVQLTTHNHATLKYTAAGSGFQQGFTDLDAWIARWDNVGFDGPVLSGFREYEVPDPLEPNVLVEEGNDVPVVSTGWTVPDESGGIGRSLHFSDVDLTNATSARVALSAWYCKGCGPPVADFVLVYRLNGNAWHDRPLNAQEILNLTTGNGQGAVGHVLDVPLAELVPGDNTFELVTRNVSQNYPPGVANVDLILATE
jgi:hypothetical protein